MYPGVTEKFLEVTLEPYKRHIGDQFGKRVLGAFTDEPNVAPAGGLPWTDQLPAVFQRRWGYSLLDHLPSLGRPVGNWKQVRHDFFQVVLDQFIEHWGKPYYEWCDRNGLAFTGHYWDHEWPNCIGVPDNMAMNAWQHMPGIDCLMNQYREDTHAQFGNVRMVKETQSVCNQLGRSRFLCEVYGAGGWDLRFEDMKRIADWLGVLGVNLFDEHLSYITLRGARKADHPQSFSYHEPWWDAYHVMAEYITRLSVAMSVGQQRNHVLVIEPTTTAWMYQADATQAARLGEIGKTFFDLLLVNTSIESPSQGVVETVAKGVQQWDLFTGTCRAYPFTSDGGTMQAAFTLPPCGSLLLFLDATSAGSGAMPAEATKTIAARQRLSHAWLRVVRAVRIEAVDARRPEIPRTFPGGHVS